MPPASKFHLRKLTKLVSITQVLRDDPAQALMRASFALEREGHEAGERLRLLRNGMEDGVAEMDDILEDRFIALKADRDRVERALARPRSALRPTVDVSPIAVERLGQVMREKLTTSVVPLC